MDRRRKTLRASATTTCLLTASILTAFVAVPTIPANAAPMIPLGPACDQYQFPRTFTIKQDNNIQVQFGNQASPNMNNVTVMYFPPGKTFQNTPPDQATQGHANGGVSDGQIDITAKWEIGPGAGLSNHYTGVVNANGTAQGMSTNSKNVQNVWASAPMTLGCVPAPQPQPGPPVIVTDNPNPGPVPNPEPNPVPPAPPTASVIQDGDLYDAPGGNGQRLGDDSYFLHAGTKVVLVEPNPCKEDFCHVVLPPPLTGTGYAYEPGFLTVP